MKHKPMTEPVFYILLSVIKPNYGYGIMETINKLTNGRISMSPGTLYGAINALLEKRYIMLYSIEKFSRKKKEYLITPLGREALKMEMKRLEEMVTSGKELL